MLAVELEITGVILLQSKLQPFILTGGFIAMLLIPQNANGELGPGDVTKLDGTCEKL